MKVEAFTAAILRKISGVDKVQMKFIIHIVHLYLFFWIALVAVLLVSQ